MLTKIAQSVYAAYLDELRKGDGAGRRRKRFLRRARRLLLKLADPDIIISLEGFSFQTPFSSSILLTQYELPFYDAVLPRLARAVCAARGGLVMIDAGANVGAVTCRVSRETAGHFFCIEANPRFKASLTHNLAQVPQSRARFAALTDEKRTATVRHNYEEGNSSIEPSNGGGETLEFLTLDEALASEPDYRAANLVKIDTEGFELKILRGAARLLSEQKPALFFEFYPDCIRREAGDPDGLFELLLRQGYNFFIFYDNTGNLLEALDGSQTDQFRSLRRYCELRNSYFDVAAFHADDAGLGRDFYAAERDFFDRTQRR
jgi:FkbM family methyltransferase